MKKNKKMDLTALDDKYVRVKTIYGEILEGLCAYNSDEYNEHEYGVNEDGLDVAGFLVYRSQVEEAKEIGEDGFSAPYGWIEEQRVAEGFDFLEDAFFSDDPIGELRLLRCMESTEAFLDDPETREKAVGLFASLVKYSKDERVKEKASELYRMYTERSKA